MVTSRIFCIKQSSDLVNYQIFAPLKVMKPASMKIEKRFMNFGKINRRYAWTAKILVIEVFSFKDIHLMRSRKASCSMLRNVALTRMLNV